MSYLTMKKADLYGSVKVDIPDVEAFVIYTGRKKLDRTDGLKWLVYSWFWTRLFPIRRYLLAFYRRIWLKIFKPK